MQLDDGREEGYGIRAGGEAASLPFRNNVYHKGFPWEFGSEGRGRKRIRGREEAAGDKRDGGGCRNSPLWEAGR